MRKTYKISKRNFTKHMDATIQNYYPEYFFYFFDTLQIVKTLFTFCHNIDYRVIIIFIIISLPPSFRGYFISTLIEIKICFLFLFYFLPKGKPTYQIIQMIITRTCYHRAIFGKCLLWKLSPTVRGRWAEGPNLLVF